MTPEINNFLASPKGAGVNDDPINDEILKIRNSRKSPVDDLLDFDCDLHGSDLLDCNFIGTLSWIMVYSVSKFSCWVPIIQE